MAKRLQIAGNIRARLQQLLEDDFDFSNIAVFETVALDTQPVNKKFSIYNKSRFSAQTLQEAADFANRDATIPLQVMHDTNVIQVGRVFDAKLNQRTTEGGEVITELRTLFYLQLDVEESATLVKKIEAGVLTDVSIGILPRHANCSECGWDFFGPEASFMNWMMQECENGHMVGLDGVHLICEGCEDWSELSLVNSGASESARIQNPKNSVYQTANQGLGLFHRHGADSFKQACKLGAHPMVIKLSKTQVDELRTRLTARAQALLDAGNTVVKAALDKISDEMDTDQAAEVSAEVLDTIEKETEAAKEPEVEEPAPAEETEEEVEEPAPVEPEAPQLSGMINLNQHVEVMAELKLSQRRVADLSTQVAELTAKIKILEGQDPAALSAAQTYLRETCKRVFTLSGRPESEIPESVPALIESINQAGAALAAALPIGGVGAQFTTIPPASKPEKKRAGSAYQTREQS